ncbi:BMP family ABC transporter substrate-binding protein [Pseudoroseicyclus tamaricis]|uniref:BMP family ABC transporter substrate-binding protein n=1 Tax=Pseudoroseicyclus tamaricis TaxID=2705421 RepID=A0A6B2K2Z7_9RHOB|nr:BMP family ABC transporter substrate-binding protein [Pseudoroseicyclus tamaricis]NDV02172.1 BMP family ABC transporter substrate-binding protein [Pseudoroseicyclus tamaricis]
MQRRTLLAATGAAAALCATLGAPLHAQDDPLTVGFIYVGPVGDGGWTYQHDQGRLEVEEHFGDAVETIYQENVPEGADAARAITQMVLAGADLIFTTSFGYMDATAEVAEQFPDVKFEHATGYIRGDNLATYDSRFYEGRAVEGLIAGHLTESNRIGYIGSFPIPEVIQGINSSFLHAQEVNPDVEMVVVWAYTWFDPAKEADAAQALIEQGVDVILQHTDSTAPQAAAEQAGNVYTFGQASDMAAFKPMPRVASIIDDWGPYYIERVQAVMDGTWEPTGTWGGMSDGHVVIGEITDAVPAEVKAEAEEMIDAISSGEYHPFTGPINKQDGSVWLEEGEVATDEQLLGMDFFVEGLTGDIPS